jgi:hypothetical protein
LVIKGLDAFIDFTKKDMLDNVKENLCCPSKHCKNEKKYCVDDVLRSHLIKHGFMEDYRCWNKHVDEGLNEAKMRDSYVEREVPTAVEDHNDVNEADILGSADDDIEFQMHNIEEMVRNVVRHGDDDQYSNGELAKYKKMIKDSKKPFYHGCAAQYTRLFVMVNLFQLKVSNRWSDCIFKYLLMLLKDKLTQDNAILKTVYETKQIIYLLGLEVEKIHTYKNDCILYRGPEYEDLEKCPICGLDRFNYRKVGSDDENCNRNRRKGRPKKVFWYFSIIAHLNRWFVNKKELELLRWHKEKHKQDVEMIRHPADATQWQNIDS